MDRNQFTFYKEFYESIQKFSKNEQADILLAVCAYALYEEEPDTLSPAAYTAFSLMRPTIDKGRNKARNGSLGGEAKAARTVGRGT